MRKQFAPRLPEELIRKIKVLSAEEGRDANKIVEEALEDYLKKKQKGDC